jgi:hypothetical protein
VAKKSGGLVNMKREITALRLIAGLIAALNPVVLGGAPAGAQEYVESAPREVLWYMPQSWVTPPQTGPKFRPLPGQYGHNYRNRTYGSFSRNCFGDRLDLPGMVRRDPSRCEAGTASRGVGPRRLQASQAAPAEFHDTERRAHLQAIPVGDARLEASSLFLASNVRASTSARSSFLKLLAYRRRRMGPLPSWTGVNEQGRGP